MFSIATVSGLGTSLPSGINQSRTTVVKRDFFSRSWNNKKDSPDLKMRQSRNGRPEYSVRTPANGTLRQPEEYGYASSSAINAQAGNRSEISTPPIRNLSSSILIINRCRSPNLDARVKPLVIDSLCLGRL